MRSAHVSYLGGLSSREASVPFNAANFSATGALVWTVGSAGVDTFRYSIQGKLMTIWLSIAQGVNSVLTGTVAGNNLLVTIPEGRVPAFKASFNVIGVPSGLPIEGVVASFTVGTPTFTILRYALNWVLGNTGITVCGVTFEVQ
jgi:hypothetical protein